jgi:hypothetical protein
VRWVVQVDFPFKDLEHFPPNPMNDFLPIKQSKNGQELPFKLGNYLCYLIYNSNIEGKKIITNIQDINKMPTHFFNQDQRQVINQTRV